MSGIAGIVRFDGRPIEPGLVEKMTAAMAHRGPDGIRHWRKGSVALGQCMLYTTPESLEETQPLPNEDESLVLVMDGRVDNWEELRRELLGRGAVLRDRSDAELVLRAYETWGRECLPHIDGDFALVIWDARRQQVFCARDRMGNKPFNYHWDGKTLTFSSELHAILAMSWIRQELNEGMLTDYLTIDWHSHDETPWKGIHRLVQAHWMAFGHGGQQSGQYWRPDFHSPLLYVHDEEYVEHYRELLTDTVRRMSRTHRVLACEVSGGLDSSALFAVAANLRRKQGLPAPGLSGFTLRFDSDSEANELDYARAVGAHVGVPVHEVDPTHMPLSWYRDWARTYKEFPGYPNGVMGWDIRKEARERGSRVLLAGIGGDEWLTGRRYYLAEELASRQWRNLTRCMQADLRDFGAKSLLWPLGRSVAVRVLPAVAQRILRTLLARTRGASISHDSWLIPELREVASQRKTRFGSPSHGIAFGRAGHPAQYRMLHAPFNVLARESEERISARLGVEFRFPLLDTAMVQFAFSTPERLRRNGRMTKVLHRRAMAGLLPSSVLERTTKAQFMTTFRVYADELRNAFAARMLKNRLEWVLPERLQETHSRFGVASFNGAPEWMLWGLFGCMALLPDEES